MRQLTRRQRLSAIVLAIVALAFLTLDLGGASLGSAHSGVRGMLGSLYRGTDTVLGPIRQFLRGVPSAGTNQARIDALRRENGALRAQLTTLAAKTRTDAQTARLQRAADARGYSIRPARVIALGPGEGFDWTVTLDAGSRDGIRVGQTATDGAGLVGRVLQVDRDTSVVLMAADPGSGVGVRDLRTGEVGVASGSGTGGFTFAPLNPDADVRVGDRLETGPTGSTSYVTGLAVGTVNAVRISPDGTVRAAVTPTVAPTAVDVVGVIAGSGARIAHAALRPSGPAPGASPGTSTGLQAGVRPGDNRGSGSGSAGHRAGYRAVHRAGHRAGHRGGGG